MKAKPADKANPSGFSLLELLLVLALMGILSALAIPAAFKISANLHLKTAAQKTLAELRFAHNQAITKSKPFWMVFDKQKNSVALLDHPVDIDKSRDNKDRAVEPPLSPLKLYALPQNVSIGKLVLGGEEVLGSRGVLIFFPNGSSNGGEIFLQTGTLPGYGITVHPLTGIAKIAFNG